MSLHEDSDIQGFSDIRAEEESNEFVVVEETLHKKHVRQEIENRLERKRLREELEDELDQEFDWDEFGF